MRNTFGNLFTLTTFGESHGIAVGGVIDGFPAGIEIDMGLYPERAEPPTPRTEPHHYGQKGS